MIVNCVDWMFKVAHVLLKTVMSVYDLCLFWTEAVFKPSVHILMTRVCLNKNKREQVKKMPLHVAIVCPEWVNIRELVSISESIFTQSNKVTIAWNGNCSNIKELPSNFRIYDLESFPGCLFHPPDQPPSDPYDLVVDLRSGLDFHRLDCRLIGFSTFAWCPLVQVLNGTSTSRLMGVQMERALSAYTHAKQNYGK